ncbi:MAG: MMPL family transporter [Actinomycetota bacterium]|nr:MMPL family transporter [Actinomycetota bacterium]
MPVLSETTVVVHGPRGLSALTRADATLWALSFAQATQRAEAPPGPGHIIAAIPIPTATADTAVTYLYMSANTSLAQTSALAEQYAAHFHNQPDVQTYVTGLAPAQLRQGYYLTAWLPIFEAATLVLIAVAVAIAFRSLVAPLAVLLVATMGYLVAIKLLGLAAGLLGFALPDELQPLIAALLLGVVTDYCVLIFFGLRRQLGQRLARHDAAQRAFAADGPIVAVAGITVAAGTAALLAAWAICCSGRNRPRRVTTEAGTVPRGPPTG